MKMYVHLQYLAEFFLEWKMFQTICREDQNTHLMFSNFFTPPENYAIYEIM